jgi:formylmethanofuran dehydrogenase subunit A
MFKLANSYQNIFLAIVLGFFHTALWAQTRSVAIVGGTLIDGTGRAAVEDSVVIVREGRFQTVGKRGEVSIPQGAEVIEAKGKSILPGLIDGHCHYRDWMGEIYLAYGVVTCPNISNNPVKSAKGTRTFSCSPYIRQRADNRSGPVQ